MRLLLGIAACLLVVASLPTAAAAKTCKLPQYPGKGSYFALDVDKVSCAEGAKVADAFTQCRTKRTRVGRCTTKVRGYTCREMRAVTKFQVVGWVSCTKGRGTVAHGFLQTV